LPSFHHMPLFLFGEHPAYVTLCEFLFGHSQFYPLRLLLVIFLLFRATLAPTPFEAA
jgi:hypothetical protein